MVERYPVPQTGGQKNVWTSVGNVIFIRSEKEGATMHSRILVLRFSKEIVDKPIITNLVRDYNLAFNILKAQIFPRKEGMLVMELRGNADDFEKGSSTSNMWAYRWSRSARGFAETRKGASSAGPVRRSARLGHST